MIELTAKNLKDSIFISSFYILETHEQARCLLSSSIYSYYLKPERNGFKYCKPLLADHWNRTPPVCASSECFFHCAIASRAAGDQTNLLLFQVGNSFLKHYSMFAQDNLFPSLGLIDEWQKQPCRASELSRKPGCKGPRFEMTKELMVS